MQASYLKQPGLSYSLSNELPTVSGSQNLPVSDITPFSPCILQEYPYILATQSDYH